MKTKLLLLAFLFLISIQFSSAQQSYAILQDWAVTAGIQDTLYKVPSAYDTAGTFISASFTVDSATGADILVAAYDTLGNLKWSRTWSGSGMNRDQASAITTDDSCNIYVAGFTFSTATNFDFVVLKYDSAGNQKWVYTHNGTGNGYDIPAAIAIRDSFVYVAGESSNTLTNLDFTTIQLNKKTGVQNWLRSYDYDSLYDVGFAMVIDTSGKVAVTGGSQHTLTSWKYAVVTYRYDGVALDTVTSSGTANSFDRATAVKSDALGNFYITGAASDTGASFNVRTAKIDSSGAIQWIVDYGTAGRDDEGNDLIVDDSSNVYVCGKTDAGTASGEDYLLIKYNSSGSEQWHVRISNTGADVANKMCFDNYGNIVITGKTKHTSYDYRTLAYSSGGSQLWSVYFDGEYGGTDNATDITSDSQGNIYVSGQSQITDSTYQQATVKYNTDYFLVPQDTIAPPSNQLFYINKGQLIDTQDSVRTTGMYYYTINQTPSLYFHTDSVSFVMSRIDPDTSVADTLERIAMSFYGGTFGQPYSYTTHTDQLLNYYLPHCSSGKSSAGAERLLYSNVYSKTDVMFSNNHAGMKFQVIVKKGGEPGVPLLHFSGHQSLEIVDNADLRVNGVLGSFIYKRPLVYQLDGSGNRISLGWLGSYNIIDSANVGFTLGGAYDANKSLVFECARAEGGGIQDSGLCWSTYMGGGDSETGFSITSDGGNNILIAGETRSPNFPIRVGAAQYNFQGIEQCFVSKFNSNDSLVYSTFWGGSNGENIAQDIKCNSSNHIFIGGYTTCTNFPTHNLTGSYFSTSNVGANGVLVEFNNNGQIVWSTYFGGRVNSLDFDSHNNFYVTGYAYSSAFPLDSIGGAYFQQSGGNWDAFVTKFNTSDTIAWSTYYGGGANDWCYSVKVDPNDNIFLYGATKSSPFPYKNPGGLAYIDSTLGGTVDDFIVKFNSSGSRKWATLIGGSGDEGLTFQSSVGPANRIAFDSGNNIYVVGTTKSSNFPLKTSTGFNDSTYADRDGYVIKFNGTNFSEQWGTYISGAGGVELQSVVVTSDDRVIIGGGTADSALILHQQSNLYYQDILKKDNHPSFSEDACIIAFDSQHNLIYSTYFGGYTGSGGEIINDMVLKGTKLFMTGTTTAVSNDFPLYNPGNGAYFDSTDVLFDVFISELCIDQLIGIDEIDKPQFPIELYPNPVLDQLTIGFELEKSEKIGISIYNSIGQCVLFEDYKANAGSNHVILHPTELSQGFYFVSVTTQQGGACKKFIKFDR